MESRSRIADRMGRALEILVGGSASALDRLVDAPPGPPRGARPVAPAEVHGAAVRAVLRIVAVLLAAPQLRIARDLARLRQGGEEAARGGPPRRVWPGLLAVVRNVQARSRAGRLPGIPADGVLFAPAGSGGEDGVARALAAFEDPASGPGDDEARALLDLLSPLVSAEDRREAAAPGARRLPSEVLGIAYEGLLEHEVRRADPGCPVVVLAAGDGPDLPLSALERMDERSLHGLLEASGRSAASLRSRRLEPIRDPRVRAWARRAGAAVGVDPSALIARVVPPSGWYLVRSRRTRKGGGSFFTPPELALPTVRRTLEPLCYRPRSGKDPRPPGGAGRAVPRSPEEILSVRVCDPAMGSGSFLGAALAYLADALARSLAPRGTVPLRRGDCPLRNDGHGMERRSEDPKALVLLHSIHGVDIDPLAVDLARLALWLEAGAPQVPAPALAEKLKAGNSLVGGWMEAVRTSSPHGDPRPALDAWCARWFRPAERRRRFFHWELEFPEVFSRAPAGFDAVLGNPPWDIRKPVASEFFSRIDPLYPTYGKQAALRWQAERFARSPELEGAWREHVARHRAFSRFIREASRSTLDRPFRHQGAGVPNSYKLFLEAAHALLRPGGRMGLIVPSALSSDKGSTALRRLFLDRCRWEWLFAFENRRGIFEIHRSFKFCAVVIGKGGRTRSIRTAFLRRDAADWEAAERHAVRCARERIEALSPRTFSILEIGEARDLEVLERIRAGGVLLAEARPGGRPIGYEREFDLTTDSRLFPARPAWEEKGYRSDGHGLWTGRGRGVALPLYEGRMIDQLDFSARGWVRGKGRRAVWRDVPWGEKRIEPQFLMGRDEYLRAGAGGVRGAKVGFMAVGASTNARSMIAAALPDFPCGNSVPVLRTGDIVEGDLPLLAVLNSFPYDYALRSRLGGQNLNRFVIEETPLLPGGWWTAPAVLRAIAALAWPDALFAPAWLELRSRMGIDRPWRACWAVTPHERLRLRAAVEAVVAAAYGLAFDDLAWILRDCDRPPGPGFAADPRDPKGFWRVDSEKDPELRLAVLVLAAYRDLEDAIRRAGGDRGRGLEEFCGGPDGAGWMVPDRLVLADLGLGRDGASRRPRPVRSRLGGRFSPWQLEAGAEESWRDCARRARGLLRRGD